MNTFEVGDRVYHTLYPEVIGTVVDSFLGQTVIRRDAFNEVCSTKSLDYYTRPESDLPEIGTHITITAESGFDYGRMFGFDYPDRFLVDWISLDGLVMGIPVEELNLSRGYDPAWVDGVIAYLDERLGVAR